MSVLEVCARRGLGGRGQPACMLGSARAAMVRTREPNAVRRVGCERVVGPTSELGRACAQRAGRAHLD